VENVPGLVKRGLDIVVTGLAEMGYDAEWQIVSAASVGAPHLRERLFIVAYSNGDSHGREGVAEPHRKSQPGGEAGERRDDFHGLRDALADTDGLLLDWARSFRPEGWPESSDGSSAAGNFQDPDSSSLESWRIGGRAAQASSRWWWATEPDVGRVAHGVPNRLAQLRALGNAIVPQVAEFVGRLILEAEGVARAA
jgi:DNA (cytosine-5)-methyltransferase 1